MAFCPYNPQLFASVSFDHFVRIWDVTDVQQPVFRHKPSVLGWLYDLKWDPFGHGLYLTGSDRPDVLIEHLWCDFTTDGTGSSVIHNHYSQNSAVWQVQAFVVDGQTAVVSTSSDGTVLSNLTSSRRWLVKILHFIFPPTFLYFF